jgi:thioredoxin reductase (NADPH)
MFDYEAVIIGGGPAGLTAGLYLSRAKRKVLLLEKEIIGGPIKNYDWIENYPGFPEGVSGAQLASNLVVQATRYGLKIDKVEATGIELFSQSRLVTCAKGKSYTAGVIILAGGSRQKRLGVPGEERLQGKGIFSCAFCDGSEYADRVVAVCGGGDSGITEALYLTRLAAKVVLLEAMPRLNATAILQDRAQANAKLEIRCGTRVEAVLGGEHVEEIRLFETQNNRRETLKVDGVLVHIGVEPNTGYLNGTVPLDKQGHIIVDDRMQSKAPYIFAAGDIRSGSSKQISTAVGDGATAGMSAERLLQEIL